MKTIKTLLFALVLKGMTLEAQIPIKTDIYGQNAWYVTNSNPVELDSYWPDIAASGVKYIRIGGIGANFSPLYSWNTTNLSISSPAQVQNLTHLIGGMRAKGIEPIVQVGFDPITSPPTPGADCPAAQSPMSNDIIADQATIAANLVDYLNHTVYPSNPIKYWIIANEPDGDLQCKSSSVSNWGFGTNGISGTNSSKFVTDASTIATYIKAFSIAMKGKDPTIKIIGPELARFGNDKGSSGGFFFNTVNPLMNELISDPGTNSNSIMGKITSGLGNGQYFVDVISFHYYTHAASRAAVISDPTNTLNGFYGNIRDDGNSANNTRGLLEMINALPSSAGRNINNLKLACTEFNIGDAETSYDESSTGGQYTNMRDGYGNRSFLAGQWMAEIFSQAMNSFAVNPITHQNESWVEFMNFWSVKENGTSANGCTDGKGYISNCPTTPSVYRSTYNHYKLLANHFNGSFFMGTTPNPSTDNLKAFASKSCDGIYIMLMNQNLTSTNYRINLDATMPSTIVSGEIRVQIGTNSQPASAWRNITGNIGGEETLVIACDPCGRPLGYYKYNKTQYTPNALVRYQGWQKSCACGGAGGGTQSAQRCANILTDPLLPQTIHADTTITDTMWVPGTTTIPSGVTLTISNAEVTFGAGAKIYIAPPTANKAGGKLVIFNSYLHGCDGKTWAGIFLSNYNDSGYVPLVIDQSTINDAITAINAARANNISITNSSFSNGVTAIKLDTCKGFTLDNNSFTDYTYGISTSKTLAGASVISNSYFADLTTCINTLNDNHSLLDITCNNFYNYANYGVHSINCTLKNQGTSSTGTGNKFTSSSVLLNNKFSHSGNNITYYTDPANTFSLVTGIGMNATATTAQTNGCNYSGRAANNEETTNNEAKILQDENIPALLGNVPNPATDQTSIYFTLGKQNAEGEIFITNMFGEIISRYKVNSSATKIDVDCTRLANGIYFTSLVVNGKITNTKKMMIAK